MVRIPHHLGGHSDTTHIDKAVLTYLQNKYQIRSFIDVGCGPGGMVDLARQCKIDSVVGIDGDPRVARADIITHDYTTGILHNIDEKQFKSPRLIWCVEFLEHVVE